MSDNAQTCIVVAVVAVAFVAAWFVLACWTTAISNGNNERYAANCAAIMSATNEARQGVNINEVC